MRDVAVDVAVVLWDVVTLDVAVVVTVLPKELVAVDVMVE
jgi:hypothetical protein